MTNKKLLLIITILITGLFATNSSAQLEDAYKAHGGLDNLKKQGTLEYDMEMEIIGKFKLSDHQLFDLKNRQHLITSEDYKIGFDGEDVWIEPNIEALGGMPPRFYSTTPFYFFGLPFFFADPGVNLEPLGTKELNGKEYNVVKVTYDKGVGDTSDDDYVAYINKENNQLEILTYIVTYPAFIKGKAIDELERSAAVYKEWQNVNGLIVPKKVIFYKWNDGELDDKVRGSMTIENVSFSEERPDSSLFQKPENAQVDNSHKAE